MASRCSTAPCITTVELYEALKTGLISMDSTMRSNLGVGLPIDVLVVRTGTSARPTSIIASKPASPITTTCARAWSAALRAAHQNIPRPPYKLEKNGKP